MKYLKIVIILLFIGNVFSAETWENIKEWEKNDFTNVEIQKISLSENVKGIDLIFYISKDINPNINDLIDNVYEIKDIFKQCDLEFKNLYIISAKDKLSNTVLSRYSQESSEDSSDSIVQFRKRVPVPRSKILFSLIKEFKDSENTSGFSFAKWKNSTDHKEELFNSIWITQYIYTDKYKDFNNNRYNIFAHELLHVLSRRGQHINPKFKSLMSIARARSNHILEKTCKSIDI